MPLTQHSSALCKVRTQEGSSPIRAEPYGLNASNSALNNRHLLHARFAHTSAHHPLDAASKNRPVHPPTPRNPRRGVSGRAGVLLAGVLVVICSARSDNPHAADGDERRGGKKRGCRARACRCCWTPHQGRHHRLLTGNGMGLVSAACSSPQAPARMYPHADQTCRTCQNRSAR